MYSCFCLFLIKMSFSIQPKIKRRIYMIVGCFAAWIIYTMIFRQIVKLDNTKMPTTNLGKVLFEKNKSRYLYTYIQSMDYITM